MRSCRIDSNCCAASSLATPCTRAGSELYCGSGGCNPGCDADDRWGVSARQLPPHPHPAPCGREDSSSALRRVERAVACLDCSSSSADKDGRDTATDAAASSTNTLRGAAARSDTATSAPDRNGGGGSMAAAARWAGQEWTRRRREAAPPLHASSASPPPPHQPAAVWTESSAWWRVVCGAQRGRSGVRGADEVTAQRRMTEGPFCRLRVARDSPQRGCKQLTA